jgi:hypothetical protein
MFDGAHDHDRGACCAKLVAHPLCVQRMRDGQPD